MIEVVCGIIYKENKVFIARRKPEKSLGGFWEFPGGKIEPGEEPKNCLVRELQEELGMEVNVGEYLGENDHDYGAFKIRLIAYKCAFVEATMHMTDHDAFEWVEANKIIQFNLAPADVPLISHIE